MLTVLNLLYKMMSPAQSRSYIALIMMFCGCALLQVAGVASLAPFIALLSNKQLMHDNALLAWLYAHSGMATENGFLMLLAITIIGLIFVTNGVSAITTWFLFKFSMRLGGDTQQTIMAGYLREPYVSFSRRNSAEIISLITNDIPRFVYMVVQPTLQLISQLLVVGIIAVALIYVDPVLALIALAVVGAGYVSVFSLLRQRMISHGEKMGITAQHKLRLLNECIGGIKEVKLRAAEELYEQRLISVTNSWLHAQTVLNVLAEMPRYLLETIAFSAMLGLAIYLLAKGAPTEQIVGILSLYATAGYKLLPAGQTIFKSMANIRGNQDTVFTLGPLVAADRWRRKVQATQPRSTELQHFTGNLNLVDVTYRYPETTQPALDTISVALPKHQITAIVGPSGAGKSTLLDVLLGLLPPTSGKLQVGTTDITPANVHAWQRRIGYVSQHIFLTDDSIANNIAFGSDIPSTPERIERVAKLAQLDSLIASLAGGADFVVGERGALLSGGQRQRVGIARALYSDPDVLIMDESTSALDADTEREIMATVATLKADTTVVLVAHRASTIRYADHIVMVREGRIEAAGPIDEIFKTSAAFRELMSGTEEVIQGAGDP